MNIKYYKDKSIFKFSQYNSYNSIFVMIQVAVNLLSKH